MGTTGPNPTGTPPAGTTPPEQTRFHPQPIQKLSDDLERVTAQIGATPRKVDTAPKPRNQASITQHQVTRHTKMRSTGVSGKLLREPEQETLDSA